MLETSARLLRLLSLFQARRYWSGAELTERLEVTSRTLRRDVDRLRNLGYPVHSTSGTAGGYQLGAGATLPPLLLDDDEAVAVAVALRTGASGTVAGIEEASVRALLKLEQVLPSRLRRRVGALHSFIVPLPPTGPTVDLTMLSTIAGACRDHEGLQFKYSAKDASTTARTVEPHRLVHTGRRWYLVAWDLEREDWRTFRVDRIDGKPSAGARFEPRRAPEGGFGAYVSRSTSLAPYKQRAKVILHASVETVAEKIPPTVGTLEAIDQHSCILQMGANSIEGLAFYLAMIGFDFDVQDPPELIERVRMMAVRFQRAGKSDFSL